jgi:phosphoribosylanthranilate isomerase
MSFPTPLWIKVCANTSLEDALLAAEAGADAVGFVLAPSPRRVMPGQVAAITRHLPPELEKIGVFVDATFDDVSSVVGACGLTGVQLHFKSSSDLPARLRERWGTELRILRVLHFGATAAEQAAAHSNDPHVDAILVDSRTATAVGGTGIAFDWTEAQKTVFRNPGKLKLIAAGGLTPSNVAEAIGTLRPWGVDAVSGLEAEPGRKEPDKVRAFVENARAAARSIGRQRSSGF